MDARSGFQRNYFIFLNEDTGYEAGQKPSGYLKLEVRDGRGRLNAAVQNLRPGNGRFDYALYLFCPGVTPKTSVYAGNFVLKPGRAELEWTFDPADTGGSGVPIEDFDVFAVIAEGVAGLEGYTACPLAAYRGGRVDWKNDFRMSRMVKKSFKPEIKPEIKLEAKPLLKPETKPEIKPEIKPETKPLPKPEMKPEIKPSPQSQLQSAQSQPLPEAALQAVPQAVPQNASMTAPTEQTQASEPLKTGDMAQLYQAGPILPEDSQAQLYQAGPILPGDSQAQLYQTVPMQQTDQLYGAGQEQQYDQNLASQDEQVQTYMPYQFYQQQPIQSYDPFQSYVHTPAEATPQQQEVEAAQMQQPGELVLGQPEAQTQGQPENVFKPEESQSVQTDEMQQPEAAGAAKEQAAQEQAAQQSEYQPPVGSGKLYTGCLYLNGNICGAILNAIPETASPCDTCKVHRGASGEQERPASDLSRLKAIMDLNFEISDPFHSKRSDYEWWKITNPVNLNNILYQNNIRSPLMFNPAVMLAHYKYHHLIVGIFTRKDGQKYVVCGVPGMHMVDRKPFGDVGKWVQADGSRSRYGAFGYWLIYLNPDDGKILNLNQE